MVRGPGRRELINYLVRMKLVSGEARRRKLDESPRFKRQMDRIREQVLEGALVADVHEKLDDATLRKHFDEHKAALERIAARHVLIRTPDSSLPPTPGKPAFTEEQAKAKADEVVRRVKAGEDFAKVAQEVSDDPQSGPEGGDLGSFTRDSKIAQFSQAAFALKEGEVSQPVRTPFGWHVIQVTQKFDTYEELADLLRHQLAPMRMDELVRDLRKNQKVELDEAFAGPEPPFDPSAPPGPPPLGAEVPPLEPR
jgi:peptidyl-prolyl cis-trans isomerase C